MAILLMDKQTKVGIVCVVVVADGVQAQDLFHYRHCVRNKVKVNAL